MPTKQKISGVLVIHNEEKVLERALKSIAGVVDEILVVHDGPCSDESINLCTKYKCKIYIRKFEGNAEPHRVWVYGQTKYNWILQIDADEYVSAELQRNLLKLAQDDSVACYEFIWPIWNGCKYVTSEWPYKKFLFKKDKITFSPIPHSEIQVAGVTKRLNYRVEHKPNYNNFSIDAFFKKHRKWTKVHAAYLLKNPKEIVGFPESIPVQLPKYYFIKKHPYLFALPLATYQSWQSIKSTPLKEMRMGIKTSILIFFYYLFLAMEIGNLKVRSLNKY